MSGIQERMDGRATPIADQFCSRKRGGSLLAFLSVLTAAYLNSTPTPNTHASFISIFLAYILILFYRMVG